MSEKTIEYFHAAIAGKKIEIECQNRDVFRTCRDYLAKFDTPDILIPLVTPEELEREREIAIVTDKAEGKTVPAFSEAELAAMGTYREYFDKQSRQSDAQLETMAICRKLANALLNDGILLFHGAAIAAEGKCYLFMAKSGTGKTTHIKKWLKQHPECFVVNGDKPLIDMNTLLVYGTPWCGKERYGTNTAVPLGGLIQLERDEQNEIVPVSFGEMLPCLLHQCHIPNPAATVSVMRLLAMLKNTPCWRLRCNMDDSAGEVSYNAVVR